MPPTSAQPISTPHKSVRRKTNTAKALLTSMLQVVRVTKTQEMKGFKFCQPTSIERVKLFPPLRYISAYQRFHCDIQTKVPMAATELKGQGYLETVMKLSVPLKQPAGKAHGLVNFHPTSSPNRTSEVPQTGGHSSVWGTIDRIHSLPFPLTSSVLPIVDASDAWRHHAPCENLSSFRLPRFGSCPLYQA